VILFGRGSWSVGRAGRATLRSVVAGVSREHVVEIEGHADAAGPEDLNQRISEQRAEAVAALLVGSGIAADQVQVRAFGERQPSRDGRSRRVEIRIRDAL
jgi:OOP family OmpA-OmpF porin